jgi:hypothetical protein
MTRRQSQDAGDLLCLETGGEFSTGIHAVVWTVLHRGDAFKLLV